MTISRRDALTGLGIGAGLAAAPALGARSVADARFLHGVASGDPAATGVVLWTRATPEGAEAGDVPLRWHVASSPDGQPLRSGGVAARAARDHTAKAEAGGLAPGSDYWFWFETARGTRSPVGRFRTLPVGAVDRVVLAAVSCQLYTGGLFNAYDAIARAERIDAVLHLGDYIYEYGMTGYGSEIGRRIGRAVEPEYDTVTLADYRMRHAQVKRDPDMQAAHARAAFICVWDDHEVANDDWIGGAENHNPATEGDWGARKAAAMQAYFEWMPIRDPVPGRPWAAIYRSFEFGDLASLVMLESRLLARSRQVAAKGEAPDPSEYASMMAERARPDRELLGPDQLAWVEGRLAASVKAGKPWQILGNQVVMARVAGPDLERQMGPARYAAVMAKLPDVWRPRVAALTASYRAGLPFNFDDWDGYPAARERLYAAFTRAGSHPLVLSGDSHATWANDLADDTGRLVATEFGVTAVTSPSYGSLLPGLGRYIAEANEEVAFCDQDLKGYLVLTLTPEAATADLVGLTTVLARPYEKRTLARFTCAAAHPRQRLAAARVA
ncbi:alkaline phosphatase D family protein [Sphingomonas bacterium]|uniref:alkaline phosphatase D family protein n=1 Tax=Sphingomonas bacterium TaxID=1895847 RepID=UPI0015761D3A|nr:alkaline phosphatase D family protein [Sphingomonas bacterium]